MSKIFTMVSLPGAGKGTLCSQLSKNIECISAGELLREEINKESHIGKKVKDIVAKGLLVPVDYIIEILFKNMQDKSKIYILDGFPRNLEQALKFDEILLQSNDKLNNAIYLKMDEKLLNERIFGRQICPQCNLSYHKTLLPPIKENICDKCNVALIQRKDDNEEVLKRRIDVFNKETIPLIDFYRERGILKEIDASQELEEKVKILNKILKGD